MKRVLVTGMSGSGKSTVINLLAARGYKAVDADCDEFSQWVAVSSDVDAYGAPVEPTAIGAGVRIASKRSWPRWTPIYSS